MIFPAAGIGTDVLATPGPLFSIKTERIDLKCLKVEPPGALQRNVGGVALWASVFALPSAPGGSKILPGRIVYAAAPELRGCVRAYS